LETDVGREVSYVVRLQPELLRGVRYVITVESGASLAFPVEGRDSRAIQSFWGAERDGGARDHHGIDIFAPRGTPVVAASEGVIRDVGVTNLGGKVVWLSDMRARQSIYYAHLDSQAVRPGDRVRPGDTLGFVGNTGNARGTAPHLHFGIYRRGEGPVDPFAFVDQPKTRAPALGRDTSWIGRAARTAPAEATLRAGPSARAAVAAEVPRHTALVVDGAADGWLRVRLPDATVGYVRASAVESASEPVRGERVAARAPILDRPASGAVVIDTVGAEPTTMPVLGRYGAYVLVEAPDGRRGWIATGD
jgi:peptidoglycan LD-endopeptidase LytH